MSMFSGKCDLYDHMSGMGGWFDKDGNPVKIGQEGVGALYSDELADFEAFKKRTGGVIHQHYKIKVDEYNQEFVKEHCKEFDYKEVATITAFTINGNVVAKASKSKKKSYIYTYYGKDYTLSELNKKGVYIEIDIHFNTLLDLIPYYPYLISFAICDGGKEYVCISNESFVDREFKEHLQHGWISGIDYKKKLQEHYLEVCRDYFLKDLDKRTKVIPISVLTCKMEGGDYYLCVGDSLIDYMHPIEYVWEDGLVHSHWCSPKMFNTHTIILSKEDVEVYLKDDIENGTIKIKYVEKLVDKVK